MSDSPQRQAEQPDAPQPTESDDEGIAEKLKRKYRSIVGDSGQ